MCNSSNHEWPGSFYFNGRELPKWSAQWHLCSLGDFLNEFQDGWDEFIGLRHVWHLQCRIDHQATIESEDPGIFQICAHQVLLCLISNQAEIIANISEAAPDGCSAIEIYEGLTTGLAAMLQLTHSCGFAFWTNGDSEDLASLNVQILKYQNSVSFEPPHLLQRRTEQAARIRFQQSELRNLAQSGKLEKQLRSIVNQLPVISLSGFPSSNFWP